MRRGATVVAQFVVSTASSGSDLQSGGVCWRKYLNQAPLRLAAGDHSISRKADTQCCTVPWHCRVFLPTRSGRPSQHPNHYERRQVVRCLMRMRQLAYASCSVPPICTGSMRLILGKTERICRTITIRCNLLTSWTSMPTAEAGFDEGQLPQ